MLCKSTLEFDTHSACKEASGQMPADASHTRMAELSVVPHIPEVDNEITNYTRTLLVNDVSRVEAQTQAYRQIEHLHFLRNLSSMQNL